MVETDGYRYLNATFSVVDYNYGSLEIFPALKHILYS